MSDDLVELSKPMTLMRTKDVKHLLDRIEELQAKLAKAVEALKDDPWHYGWHQWRDRIIALLAELQGDKT